MSDEPVPDWVAQLDQALRAMGDVARVVRGFYQALVAEGFTEAQALELAKTYTASLLTGSGE